MTIDYTQQQWTPYEGEFTTTVLKTKKAPKRSLWGVKGRHSGVNRKGQVAAPVGRMPEAGIASTSSTMRAR